MEKEIRLNPLIFCFLLSVLSLLLLLILILACSILPFNVGILTYLTLPTFIALFLVPKLIELFYKRKIEIVKQKKYTVRPIFSIGIFLLLLTCYWFFLQDKFENGDDFLLLVFHYLIVSLGEEYMYRDLMLNSLRSSYSVYVSVILSSILFAFIGHINESIMINLVVRFPLGLILGWIASKTNSITYPIIIHTLYNLIVS